MGCVFGARFPNSCCLQTLLLTGFSQLLLQDIFLPPSRVSMETLKEKYFLPSALSNYEQIAVGNHSSLGVHFLKYENRNADTTPRAPFDALYVLHGFGASSLSWLPPLPALVERLGARVGLGHDAVGFGFTERPTSSEGEDSIGLYTTRSSATIAREILTKEVGSKPESVAIFGHSLGGLTALKLALQLPRRTSKMIILSAPALGIRRTSQRRAGPPPWVSRAVFKPLGSLIRKAVFYPAGGYVLRRVVG
jgi:pimeloyl-ACP methyl ester carboxylesterase